MTFIIRPAVRSIWGRPHFRVRGFSLVEVALALAVCAFSLLTIMSLLPVALGVAGKSVDMTRRARVIQQILNELQQADFSDLIANTGGWKWTFDSDGLATDIAAQTVYTVTARVPQGVMLPGGAVNPEMVTIVLEIQSHLDMYRQLVPVVVADRGN